MTGVATQFDVVPSSWNQFGVQPEGRIAIVRAVAQDAHV
jgi:sulfur carrier protein ThiS